MDSFRVSGIRAKVSTSKVKSSSGRKSPVRHYRKEHVRKGKVVKSTYAGHGYNTFVYKTKEGDEEYNKFPSTDQRTLSDHRTWQKEHPNFITPHIVSATLYKGNIIELSSGSGFGGGTIYGVTILKKSGNTFKSVGGESFNKGGFDSKSDAIAHLNKVKAKL